MAPHLWYTEKIGEAAKYYESVFPDWRIDTLTTIPADTPSGPAGVAKRVSDAMLKLVKCDVGALERAANG